MKLGERERVDKFRKSGTLRFVVEHIFSEVPKSQPELSRAVTLVSNHMRRLQ